MAMTMLEYGSGTLLFIRYKHVHIPMTLLVQDCGNSWGGGTLHPETGRGEGSAVYSEYPRDEIYPHEVSNFHKNDPKRVAKYENSTNITQREWLKMKKLYPTGVCLTFEYPTRGCTGGEKRGSKGRHTPTDSNRRSVPPGGNSSALVGDLLQS